MSYTNALQIFFEKLNYQHTRKGESFRELSHLQLDILLTNEIEEWKDAIPNTHHEIHELADIMVCCILKIEKLMEESKDEDSQVQR